MIAILLISSLGIAQVKGDKNITTKTFELEKIQGLKIDIYAKVIVDDKADNKITIKADDNLINLIDRNVENGILHLNQLEWIQASQKIEIEIGAPDLTMIETGTHDNTILKNFSNEKLKIIAPIGNLKTSGTTDNLIIEAKKGIVDASQLIAKNASITITGSSKTIINVVNEVKQTLSDKARLEFVNKPTSVIGDSVEKSTQPNQAIKWIRIKNNSWNRKNLVVVGPKNDGSQFSYGFAMMPGTTKKERWTVGSKVYKEGKLGSRELLVIVTEENENQLIKLFK
ncbi:GIN domain-containing protein [Croceitalea rosinachiae]|uniref:DUF2807 domain-containing protein n=1 Tax=Croceitalea rosinachiae TaxID=3075596 RepID=A0ABU3A6N0_9FLAO|nr:DUF2807 domain-containing protein [Croceitalea sp. F388]MDT0605826.1 DUF2807 domain-containing protein [Croceitalea sp. F388]